MSKIKKPRPLSWKPRLSGETYCAPACGYGCTVKAHEIAQRRAVELCRALGDGWTPRVWENMGWHFSAVSACGRLKVHWNGLADCRYHAFLGEGQTGGRWAEHGRTPQSAVRNVVKRGKEELAGIDALLRGLPVLRVGKR